MQVESSGDAARAPRLLSRLLAPTAFLWVFLCAVFWQSSGARHSPTGFDTSVRWGFIAAAPAFLAAAVIFVSEIVRLVRARPAFFDSIFFSAGAIFGGVVMDLMVWDLYVTRLYPSFYSHGRRLHHQARILAAPSTHGAGWIGTDAPRLPSAGMPLSAAEREAVAAQWRENASKEHASIAAFAHHTIDLMAAGAPATLIAAAQRAGLDEVEHAKVCYGLARAIDGRDESPMPFPEAQVRRKLAPRREVALAQIAVDALADGALNEGIAARILARLTRRAATPELAAVLAQMARDEARHARDSWDVIEWCLAAGGDVVRNALVRARETMPEHLGSPIPDAAREGAWEAWGIQGVALEIAEYAAVRRNAQQRLDVLLRVDARSAA